MHIHNVDTSEGAQTDDRIKECIAKKEDISCIGPHAIFSVIKLIEENTFFTVTFKTFDSMSGIVFHFACTTVPDINFKPVVQKEVRMKTSANTNVKSLSTALFKTFQGDDEISCIKISCIGKSSINQTVKSLANYYKQNTGFLSVSNETLKNDPEDSPRVVYTFKLFKSSS